MTAEMSDSVQPQSASPGYGGAIHQRTRAVSGTVTAVGGQGDDGHIRKPIQRHGGGEGQFLVAPALARFIP